jgi:hypothetical protein
LLAAYLQQNEHYQLHTTVDTKIIVYAIQNTERTAVENMRLKSLGAVSAPGVPVAGDGITVKSSAVASVRSRSTIGASVPCLAAFRFICMHVCVCAPYEQHGQTKSEHAIMLQLHTCACTIRCMPKLRLESRALQATR